VIPLSQPSVVVKCPSCGSSKVWKDGICRTTYGDVQRYLCRDCGYRFSDNNGQKGFKSSGESSSSSRIGVSKTSWTKNLAITTEPLNEDRQAGATKLLDRKREFAAQLQRNGYSPHTIKACMYYLDLMERKGINILNPEQVKDFIVEQK